MSWEGGKEGEGGGCALGAGVREEDDVVELEELGVHVGLWTIEEEEEEEKVSRCWARSGTRRREGRTIREDVEAGRVELAGLQRLDESWLVDDSTTLKEPPVRVEARR